MGLVKVRSFKHVQTLLRRGHLGIGQVHSVERRTCDVTVMLSSYTELFDILIHYFRHMYIVS